MLADGLCLSNMVSARSPGRFGRELTYLSVPLSTKADNKQFTVYCGTERLDFSW